MRFSSSPHRPHRGRGTRFDSGPGPQGPWSRCRAVQVLVGRVQLKSSGGMSTMRSYRALLIVTPLLLALGCDRRGAVPANDITASFKANRMNAPLDSAIEVTYTWTTGPAFKKVEGDYRALVHFVDQGKVLLFTDD